MVAVVQRVQPNEVRLAEERVDRSTQIVQALGAVLYVYGPTDRLRRRGRLENGNCS